jgi:hypothetical protein
VTKILPTLACVAAALALMPAGARGDLALQIGPSRGPQAVDVFIDRPGTYSLDLVFNESGAPQNEGLFTYEVGIRVVRPVGVTDGVRLLTGAAAFQVSPNFVFPGTPPPEVVLLESTADYLHLAVTSGQDPPTGLADINSGDTAGRVFFVVEPAWPPGQYWLEFEPADTSFLSGDPSLPLEILVDVSDRGVLGVPEPTGVATLAAAGVLMLRRGRRTRGR